jgi:hypothetical protein
MGSGLRDTDRSERATFRRVCRKVLPLALLGLTLVAACAPAVDEGAAKDDIRSALAAIDGVNAVEDFGTRTDYGKEIHARLVMEAASTVDPQVVLEQGIRVLWTWPAWQPGISLSVEQGSTILGATSLVDPASNASYLSPSDVFELFGDWPGEPTAAHEP